MNDQIYIYIYIYIIMNDAYRNLLYGLFKI